VLAQTHDRTLAKLLLDLAECHLEGLVTLHWNPSWVVCHLVAWGKSPEAAYLGGVTLTTTVEFHACQQQYLERSFASSISEREPLQHRVRRPLRRQPALVEHDLAAGEGLPHPFRPEGAEHRPDVPGHLETGHREMGVERLRFGLVADRPEGAGHGARQRHQRVPARGGPDPHHPGPSRLRERARAAETQRKG